MTIEQVQLTPEAWRNFWVYFRATNEQQRVAIEILRQHILESDPALLTEAAAWVAAYRETPPAPAGVVTPELMHRLTGYRAEAFDQRFCDDFNLMLEATGFDKHPEALQMLMANLMHESCNFVYMKEIASGDAYEGRHDLGNTQPGDGRRFKGCGPLQVTGRVHFQQFYDWLKQHRGIADPRILAEGTSYVADQYPFEIAISWILNNHLLDVCNNQGFEACCVRINGGHNGYADRLAKYQICKKVMG
jgi:predicted chitinase